ncbi:MAG: hypothetical protein HOB32_08180, partial [Nitrospina sp.]|nr:hypothetical protein [Nitrospina sp.]
YFGRVEELFGETGNDSYTRSPASSYNSGKVRTLSSLHEVIKYLLWRTFA